MAINKKFTIKKYNGTDFDIYYPKTIIGQVDNLQTELTAKEVSSNKVSSISSSSTDTQYPSAKCVYDNVSTKANKSTYTTSTLNASSWSNKTYSLEDTYPFASYDLDISIAPSATETQRDAYAAAMMTGSPTSNVITALGEVPGVDLPVFLKVTTK